MDILLNYQKDHNNGISTINNLIKLNFEAFGQPCMTDKYLIIPIKTTNLDDWRILSYKYDSDVNEWGSHQTLDETWVSTQNLQATLTVHTNLITNILSMGILNNDTGECYIYRLDSFERWFLFQTVTVPISLPNVHSLRFSMDEYHLVISDYTINKIYVFLYDGAINQYRLETTITGPGGSVRFGASVCIRQTTLIVGDPYASTFFAKAGKVYVYFGYGDTWILEMILTGDVQLNAYFGHSVDAFVDVLGNVYQLVVGSPGNTNSRGKAYFYHKTMPGIWTIKNAVTAPAPFLADNNQFGSSLSMWNDQCTIAAGNEGLGQGAIYCFAYAGTWAIDTLSDGINPARFTHLGQFGYGQIVCQSPQVVFSYIPIENGYFLNREALGWAESLFLHTNQIYVKTTSDQSFFHSASGNQTIVFKLETPIQGRFRVRLDMENSLQTVGSHNDTIYISFDGVFRSVKLDHGNYTGDELASHLKLRLDLVFPGEVTFFVRWEAGAQKFTVITDAPFAWGSDSSSSFKNSGQNKLLGFYDDDYTIVHGLYGSNRRVDLNPPNRIGFTILEAIPDIPVRNNGVFSECGLIADLDAGRFKITDEMNNLVTIPYKTNSITCTFQCIDGGGLLNINTNDVQLRLTHV